MTEHVIYSFDRRLLVPGDVARRLHQTAWAATRPPHTIQAMIDGAVCVGAWHDGHLIGFARAITDDVYRAFIEDVVVDETWRGHGTGGELVRQLLTRLDHVEEIILSCEDTLVPYYERFGFRRVTHQFMNIWKGAGGE